MSATKRFAITRLLLILTLVRCWPSRHSTEDGALERTSPAEFMQQPPPVTAQSGPLPDLDRGAGAVGSQGCAKWLCCTEFDEMPETNQPITSITPKCVGPASHGAPQCMSGRVAPVVADQRREHGRGSVGAGTAIVAR